jgi:hypothetical protein
MRECSGIKTKVKTIVVAYVLQAGGFGQPQKVVKYISEKTGKDERERTETQSWAASKTNDSSTQPPPPSSSLITSTTTTKKKKKKQKQQ